jgi:hypothetical protein
VATVRVTVRGALGQISARSFTTILQKSVDVLQHLDRRMSEQRLGTVDWVITHLHEGSAVVELGTRPRPQVNEDFGQNAIRSFTAGIQHIQDVGETPAYFSQEDLLAVRDIVRQFGRDGVSSIEFVQSNEQPVELTAAAEPELQKLVGIRYRAFGSVEGRVEMISVRKGTRRFNITHSRTLRSVRCNLPESIEASVIEAMRDKRRVVATGIVGSNAKDEPISLDVRQPLRFLGEGRELPSSNALAGSDPQITGDRLIEDYVRTLRDE